MIRRLILPRFRILLSPACVFAFTALAGIVTAAEVTATRLDGTTITGDLLGWNDNNLQLKTPAGDQQIATNQLLSIHWAQANNTPATADKHSGTIELIDGSILPIKSIRIEKSQASITLAVSETGDGKPLSLPIAQLAVIRFRQLDGKLATQWEEMRRLNLAN